MNKCLHSSTNGSCPLDAIEGSLFCKKHSDDAQLRRNYLLEDKKLRDALEGKLASSALMSIREELALLRVMIEDRLNLAKTDADKLVAYNQITTWIALTDKLTNSVNRLEKEADQVLSKEALMGVAQAIIGLLSEEIKKVDGYEDVIDAVCVRIVPVIEEASNKCKR